MSRKRRNEERCFGGMLAAVVAGCVLVPTLEAQEPGNVTIDVSDCVALEKPGERLDCFERQLEAQRRAAAAAGSAPPATPAPTPAASAPAAPTPAAPASPAPTPPRETARATIPAPATVEELRGRRRDDDRADREFFAVVTDLRETVPNTWTITLDNGQIWRQSPPKFYPLRPGTRVRLYPTGWGTSYRLTVAEQKGFIQVERVR